MDKEKMRSLMIDHIDGNLTGELEKYVENHINKDEAARKEYDDLKKVMNMISTEEELELPSHAQTDFNSMLSAQKEGIHTDVSKHISMFSQNRILYRVAAAVALVLIGFAAGKLLQSGSSQAEMEALREEIQETKELIMVSMMKEESASERIKGVMASYAMQEADVEILTALIRTMNHDDNINVRVAAVEALSNFSNDEMVRDALIQSLSTQEYPMVQLKLIELMVKLGEQRAVDQMKKIIEDESVLSSVRDEAQMGIFKLM